MKASLENMSMQESFYISTAETLQLSEMTAVSIDSRFQRIQECSREFEESFLKPFIIESDPPFLTHYYGKIRKTLFNKFMTKYKDLSEEAKRIQKAEFFKNIDLKYQKKFEETVNLPSQYEKYVFKKNLKVSTLQKKAPLDLKQDERDDLEELKQDVLELSINWYLTIDRASDAYARIVLYELNQSWNEKDLYQKLKEKYRMPDDQNKGWLNTIKGYAFSVLQYTRQFASKNAAIEEYRQIQDVDAVHILKFVLYSALDELLSNYEEKLKKDIQRKNLLEVKGYLETLNQNLELVVKLTGRQTEKCLLAQDEKDFKTQTQELGEILNILFNLKEEFEIIDPKYILMLEEGEGIRKFTTSEYDKISLCDSLSFRIEKSLDILSLTESYKTERNL